MLSAQRHLGFLGRWLRLVQAQIARPLAILALDIAPLLLHTTQRQQDKLGVLIGLDEECSSARISPYGSGKHQPSLKTI